MTFDFQESTLPDLPLNEDNVIDSYGDVMTEEEGDGNELALLITEVKSLRDSGGEISEQTIIPADDQVEFVTLADWFSSLSFGIEISK